MNLTELSKPHGTSFQYWLENLKRYTQEYMLPDINQIGMWYHQGKTVQEVKEILVEYPKPTK